MRDELEDDYEPVYATLHFYYGDPDSMRRFRLCNKAEDLMCILFDLDQWMRDEVKYNDREEIQIVRNKLWDLCDHHEIDPWDD